ncbi:Nephrocystin-4 [Cladochytrium tenue]|nr:Nephrocystin-4 [Cladochytrium tenue]
MPRSASSARPPAGPGTVNAAAAAARGRGGGGGGSGTGRSASAGAMMAAATGVQRGRRTVAESAAPRSPTGVAARRAHSPVADTPARRLLGSPAAELANRSLLGGLAAAKDELAEALAPTSWLRRFRSLAGGGVAPHAPAPGSLARAVGGPGAASLAAASPARGAGAALALRAELAAPPLARFPYQLALGRLDGLPLPPGAAPPSYASDATAPLLLQLRVSLFDAESGAFFGRTWVAPAELDVRAAATASGSALFGDLGSSGDVRSGSVRRSARRGGRRAASSSEELAANGSSFELSSRGPAARSSSSSIRPKRGRGQRNQHSESDDDYDSEEDEEDNGSERSDIDEHEEGGTSSAGSSGSDVERSSGDVGAGVGQRVSVNFSDEYALSVYNRDSHLLFTAENRFKRHSDPSKFKPEYTSAGWSFFRMFDQRDGGLDLEAAWEVPIFYGTPRILPFIAPLLVVSDTPYPSLVMLADASFTFHFSTRPDLRRCCYLWRENTFVGPHDDHPGLIVQPSDVIFALPTETVTVSKIRVSVFPSLPSFETTLLSELAVAHQKQFPNSIRCNEDGTVLLPEIIERSVHVGLHNAQTFLSTPVVTMLLPVHGDDGGPGGFEMAFSGNVELDRYFRHDGLAVVFIVEYKVLLLTEPEVTKKSGLSGLIERMSPRPKDQKKEKLGVEKVVSIGWGAWVPALAESSGLQAIPLLANAGSNPYSTEIYFPINVGEEFDETDQERAYAVENGRLATREIPVVLSFFFNESSASRDVRAEAVLAVQEQTKAVEEPTEKPIDDEQRKPQKTSKKTDEVTSDAVLEIPAATEVKSVKIEKPGALGRSERSRLLHAGFSLGFDEEGFKPEAIHPKGQDGRPLGPLDPELENRDIRSQNDITMTFMGITFMEEAMERTVGRIPTRVYFTYQFFNFPYCSTEKGFVYTGPMPPQRDAAASLHLRSSSVPSHSHARAKSSVSLASNNSYGDQKGWSQREPHWPSILYVEDDNGLLRTESPGLSATFEVQGDDTPTIAVYHRKASAFVNYLSDKRVYIDVWDGDALLHLGSASVELRPVARQGKPSVYVDVDVDIVHSVVIKENVILRDFRYQIPFRPETISHPKKMVDVDTELALLLSEAYQDRLRERKAAAAENDGQDDAYHQLRASKAKMERIKRIKARAGRDDKHVDILSFAYTTTRQERSRDLQTINIFRERVVTSRQEWTYLRRIYSIRDGIEDSVVEAKPDGYYELVVRANETIAVPFIYQSMLGGCTTMASNSPQANHEYIYGNIDYDGVVSRTINIAFLNSRRRPVALLDVVVTPQFYAVDRVLRVFRPEHDVLRMNVDLDGHGQEKGKRGATAAATTYDAKNPFRKFVRCSHDDVVCTISEGGKFREVSVKYRVGPAPGTDVFYLLFYDDPFFVSLSEVWRVFVHSLTRLDMTCTIGQTNHATMVLRGSTYTRSVQFYTNMATELFVAGPAPLLLAANSLNEVGLTVRPKGVGTKEAILNVIDVHERSLVNSWLVHMHLVPPTVTKSFEISVPSGKIVNKRVSYTNPYSTRHQFFVKTDAEHLVQFRDSNVLDLDGRETQYIGLRLLPPPPPSASATTDVLIFLNDENDKMEECLLLRVTRVPEPTG